MSEDNKSQLRKEVEQVSTLTIRPQTVDEEFDYLMFVLNRMPFYKQKGYSVELPNNPKFLELAQNVEEFQASDKTELKQLFEHSEYEPEFFAKGLEALNLGKNTIETTFSQLYEFNKKWGFKLFPQYEIHLTRYGPGGNFNQSTGTVRMMTRADGSFKRPHPTHTAVHEIVHIGVEEGIVEKFNLSHWEKERLVDRICLLKFGSILKGYQIQQIESVRLDPYVTDATLDNLPNAIKEYVDANPR